MERTKFELEVLKESELLFNAIEPFHDLRAGMVDISTDLGKWRNDEEEAIKYSKNLIAEFEHYFDPFNLKFLKKEINEAKNFDKMFRTVYEFTGSEIVERMERFYSKYQFAKYSYSKC